MDGNVVRKKWCSVVPSRGMRIRARMCRDLHHREAIAQALEDAERYRWVRDECDDPEFFMCEEPDDWNATIDTAIKAARKEGA
jgi:hypothetical protein